MTILDGMDNDVNLTNAENRFIIDFAEYADMAELADALDLGSSGNPMQVQVLLSAPLKSSILSGFFILTVILELE